MVHKSTHHFDLVNWWLDAIPAQVFAYGDLAYYGRANAIRRGDDAWTTYPRYTGQSRADDPFAFSLEKDFFREAYLEAEQESGYIRDRNVFREDITIEDTMSVLVKYRAGQTLGYTLTAFNSIEGLFVSLIGDRGRIEYSELHQGAGLKTGPRLLLMPHFQDVQEILVHIPEEGHGGGDVVLAERIFGSLNQPDPLGRDAGVEQGIISALTGIAANQSIESNRPVNLSDLVSIGSEAVSLHELV